MSVKASQISFNEAILRLAQIHEKVVEFRYEKGKNMPIETRRLKPTSITESKEHAMIFVGYDPDRDDTRSFRVDRIKGEVRFV